MEERGGGGYLGRGGRDEAKRADKHTFRLVGWASRKSSWGPRPQHKRFSQLLYTHKAIFLLRKLRLKNKEKYCLDCKIVSFFSFESVTWVIWRLVYACESFRLCFAHQTQNSGWALSTRKEQQLFIQGTFRCAGAGDIFSLLVMKHHLRVSLIISQIFKAFSKSHQWSIDVTSFFESVSLALRFGITLRARQIHKWKSEKNEERFS